MKVEESSKIGMMVGCIAVILGCCCIPFGIPGIIIGSYATYKNYRNYKIAKRLNI